MSGSVSVPELEPGVNELWTYTNDFIGRHRVGMFSLILCSVFEMHGTAFRDQESRRPARTEPRLSRREHQSFTRQTRVTNSLEYGSSLLGFLQMYFPQPLEN